MSYIEASCSNEHSQSKKQQSFHNNRDNTSTYVHSSDVNFGCMLQKNFFQKCFCTEVSINCYNIWLDIVFDK